MPKRKRASQPNERNVRPAINSNNTNTGGPSQAVPAQQQQQPVPSPQQQPPQPPPLTYPPNALALIKKFRLSQLPPIWLSLPIPIPELRALAQDPAAWNRYSRAGNDGIGDTDKDPEYNAMSCILRRHGAEALKLGGADEKLARFLLKQTNISWSSCLSDDDSGQLGQAHCLVRVWSPFAIPTGIEVCMHYFHGWNYGAHTAKFEIKWRPRPLSGDDNKYETLFQVLDLAHPPLGSRLETNSHYINLNHVYNHVTKVTPHTLSRIRTAVFGPLPDFCSKPLCSDYALLHYLVSCCGGYGMDETSDDAGSEEGEEEDQVICPYSPGYSWEISDSTRSQLARDRIRLPPNITKINWLQHAARQCTGVTAKIDKYYESYDVQMAKMRWGQTVKRFAKSLPGSRILYGPYLDMDDDELEDFYENLEDDLIDEKSEEASSEEDEDDQEIPEPNWQTDSTKRSAIDNCKWQFLHSSEIWDAASWRFRRAGVDLDRGGRWMSMKMGIFVIYQWNVI